MPIATKSEGQAQTKVKLAESKAGGGQDISPDKIEKEYALLSPGQLSLLRIILNYVSLTIGKKAELVNQMSSPTLKILLQNIVSGIPKDIDLTELNSETASSLERALSLIHQVRTTESGPAVNELESLIDAIHVVSGDYHP